MGHHFYDNDFEDFLKEQSDQFRMYPSDHVWRSIQKEIHGPTKWPALTVIAILIIAALVIGTVAVKKDIQFAVVSDKLNNTVTTLSAQKESIPNSSIKEISDNLSVEKLTSHTIALAEQVVNEKNTETLLILTDNDNVTISLIQNVAAVAVEIPFIEVTQQPTAKDMVQEKVQDATPISNGVSGFTTSLMLRDMDKTSMQKNQFDYYYSFPYSRSYSSSENYTSQFSFALAPEQKKNKPGSPLSRFGTNKPKFDFQFYLTPSVSYRRLVDNAEGTLTKSYITALPLAANYVVDVNQVINHRPAMGFEVGFSLGYNLNKKFALRSGFQFNMQQYHIDAFVHSFEPATISLSSGNTNEMLNTVSGFRSISGSVPIELSNRYYQISLPIGFDWRPINKKISWGIAASVQPTYTFDKEPFIITSNYKNYADGSQLMHNFNINTNLETYLGYNTGKYRWQIGPQIRYQVLPTMSSSYPIREYLVDYGIKVGLVRSLQ